MDRVAASIIPMRVGARVADLAPGAENDPAVKRALYEAWLAHGFLVFSRIDSIERHLAISRCFGELELHPMPEVRSNLNPLLIDLGGAKRNPSYVYDDRDLRINRIPWHRDTAYTPDICKGAMLRMVEVPVHEGETLVADTAMAYDDLPEGMRRTLDGLEYKATLRLGPVKQTRPGAIWTRVRPSTIEEDPASLPSEDNPAVIRRYPSVVHPAVLTHPESGRRCIFLSPTYVDQFLGLTAVESDELLAEITSHMLKPRYIYEHKWQADDAILWDNRRCMHAGRGNRLDEPRWGLRTTLAGALRTGRFFSESDTRADLPLLAD
jgi:taurine dioxygenase